MATRYVGDNPITRNDPSGLYCVQGSNGNWIDQGSGGETCAQALSDSPDMVTVNGSQATQQDYMFALGVAAATARTEIKRAAINMAINGAMAGIGTVIGLGAEAWLSTGETTAPQGMVEATVHGANRLAEASRLDPVQAIEAELQATMRYTQADGAKVFVQEITSGKFNVVVKNPATNRIVTVLRSIDSRALANLARNYGWY